MNSRVLAIDLDSGFRCLDTVFGIDESVVFDLADALAENDLKKAVYTSKYYKNVSVIPAPANRGKIDFGKLHSLIEAQKKNYDFIFLSVHLQQM